MSHVRPKKHLGQHFLKDQNIAQQIVGSLRADGISTVIEVGAGTGVLTQYLLQNPNFSTHVIEIDSESIVYLQEHFPELNQRLLQKDFLRYDISLLGAPPIAIIGNFPYNISSQIFFKVLEHKNIVNEVVCMIQKEVAERIASPAGKKAYGILSVFLQAYYSIEYLFTVDEHVFIPPPKVKSGVIRLIRNDVQKLDCNEDLFWKVVKTGFNQRRKTLRNSLKSILNGMSTEHEIFNQRPEQLTVPEFVMLTNMVEGK